ncbi:MAG: iron-siderophore ABC transporter substrate-binding protein [Pleurocapsa minor HA4230-MV1]|jgi:iron complex transport system substrate-binding protein|nr:iron-siderophore ABC transporter substrate-binding protein [Pleurocapsa minor HA4230-MV1]
MKLSTQGVLKLLTMMLMTILISIGCSHNSPEPTSSKLASLSTAEYRLVKDAIAEVKVPLNPQRLVTLHGTALESILALGEKPVGTTLNGDRDRQPDFLKKQLDDVEIVGSFSEPNLEKTLLLKPDLILDLGTPTAYSQLSQIAPTITSESQPSNNWQPNLKLYAEALGKPKLAAEIIANYYSRLEQFKAAINKKGKPITVSVVRIYPQGITFYQPDSFSGAILKDAGLSRPPLQNKGGGQQLISQELISEADADIIFYWAYGDDYHSKEDRIQHSLEQLKSDPLWLKLNAVKQGKVYQVPDYWIGYGPLAANAVIDDLYKYILDK